MAEKFKKKKSILKSFDEGSKGEQIIIDMFQKIGHKCEKSTGMLVHDLIIDDTYHAEVKYDLMSRKTGNLAIEYHNSKKDTPSGINATTADFWFHIVFTKAGEQKVLYAFIPYLREWIVENKPLKNIKGGGDDNADLYIYKLEDITSPEGAFIEIDANDLAGIILFDGIKVKGKT